MYGNFRSAQPIHFDPSGMVLDHLMILAAKDLALPKMSEAFGHGLMRVNIWVLKQMLLRDATLRELFAEFIDEVKAVSNENNVDYYLPGYPT